MYGLLVENFSEYVKAEYGDEKWEEIRRLANINQISFSTHKVYEEDVIPRLAKVAVTVLGVTEEELMFAVGEFFVEFVGQYGYDRVLSVLGRHVRDFLNGLDNLHEYLKDAYPEMKPPSFFCENETSSGMLLHYRSKRKGYAHYTMGQIKQVARRFYNTDMEVVLLKKYTVTDTLHVTFQLTFDNRAFVNQVNLTLVQEEQSLSLKGNILFEIFPFCILFGSKMVVQYIGNSLMQTIPELVNKRLTDWFTLSRPHVDFTFSEILKRTNNIFELVTKEHVYRNREKMNGSIQGNSILTQEYDLSETAIKRPLRLKGQMIYMEEWELTLFLGTPVMLDLDSMIYSGLFINDLSMHDFSRDRMLAGTQQSVELELALSQEQLKSKKLEESMKKLDEEKRRTDELLYQMIPMQVAQRLRNGENPVDTCETFESVTILFSDVVNFTHICSRITPMAVVSMLNEMYSIFDNLTEKHGVYKVETIGDAYMVVAGAPERQANHGEMVCNMALDMVEAITKLPDPSTESHLKIRVGVHSGTVVAGVVGLKMPRYCLFGDAVNTASRMESTSEAMKVHISQTTKDILSSRYQVEERKEIAVKGKGDMKTYWLLTCEGRISCMDTVTLPQAIEAQADQRRGSNVSRNYSPILREDVMRYSQSTTPTPSIQTPAHPPSEVISPRARTYSNAGFSNIIIPFTESSLISTSTYDLQGQRLRSHSCDKPYSAPSIHYGNHNVTSHQTSASQHTLLPDVLIDNHHACTDGGALTLSDSSPTPPPVEKTPHVETVDRGTSPIVSHAACSGFNAKNRVHSHTCVVL